MQQPTDTSFNALNVRLIHILTCLIALVSACAVAGEGAASGTVKNVILMVADGAGYNSWDAASSHYQSRLGLRPDPVGTESQPTTAADARPS